MTAPMPETMGPRKKVAEIVEAAILLHYPSAVISDTLDDASAILAVLASSGDHAELARLAEAASGQEWRVASPPFAVGASYIETELPCINGLNAWFSVALVPQPSPEETGYSEGALDADANAAFIAAANPATVQAIIAEVAALREAGEAIAQKAENAIQQGFKHITRATEAERKLAEADRKIEDLTSALRSLAEGNLGDMSWQANYETIKQVARNALSKEAERG